MTTENREESFKFYDSDGKSRSIYWMVRNEQSWAANRLVHGRRLEIKNKEQQVKINKLQAELREMKIPVQLDKDESVLVVKEVIRKLQAENAKLLKGLRELAYDVFFKPENQNTDVQWHNDYCTAYENIADLLGVDVSHGDFDKIGRDLKELSEKG